MYRTCIIVPRATATIDQAPRQSSYIHTRESGIRRIAAFLSKPSTTGREGPCKPRLCPIAPEIDLKPAVYAALSRVCV